MRKRSQVNYSENKFSEFPNGSGTHDLPEYRLDTLTNELLHLVIFFHFIQVTTSLIIYSQLSFRHIEALSTLIRFQTKTELFCSGYGYRPHYNAETITENGAIRKRCHSKTLSRVERFENDAVRKRCFLLWTEKTMLSENGDVIK